MMSIVMTRTSLGFVAAVGAAALQGLGCSHNTQAYTPSAGAAGVASDPDGGQPGAGGSASGSGGTSATGGTGTSVGGTGGSSDCAGVYGGPPSHSPPVPGSWTLAFQDDFDGDRVDGSKWKMGAHWAGFPGLAAHWPDQLRVDCGYVTFTADRQTVSYAGGTRNYVSAELSTFKRFRQRYGYFEARVKYDSIRGMWPAFWLMPDRAQYGFVDDNRISYLKFDLTSDSRSSVQSATLTLDVESAEQGAQNVILLSVPDDGWSESTITWNNRPNVDPAWIEMKYDPKWSAGSVATFDVTEVVNRALGGDRVVSFALVDGFMRARRVSFHSKEAQDAAKRPRLVLSGSPSLLLAAEDASVGEGAFANKNLGAEVVLHVKEDWGNTTSTYDGGMEIDIMESLGTWGDHVTSHTLHWDGYDSDHKHEGSGRVSYPSTSDGFHVYGMHWQPGTIDFYVDGKKTWSHSSSRVANVAGFILLSLQVGGWADDLGDNGVPDDAALPGSMVIDYVRVFSGN
jgi:beta-glucanase (GH16 family)